MSGNYEYVNYILNYKNSNGNVLNPHELQFAGCWNYKGGE